MILSGIISAISGMGALIFLGKYMKYRRVSELNIFRFYDKKPSVQLLKLPDGKAIIGLYDDDNKKFAEQFSYKLNDIKPLGEKIANMSNGVVLCGLISVGSFGYYITSNHQEEKTDQKLSDEYNVARANAGGDVNEYQS